MVPRVSREDASSLCTGGLLKPGLRGLQRSLRNERSSEATLQARTLFTTRSPYLLLPFPTGHGDD